MLLATQSTQHFEFVRFSMIKYTRALEIWLVLALIPYVIHMVGFFFQESRLTNQLRSVTIILAPLKLLKINIGSNEHT